MTTVKMAQYGQVTIPKTLRDQYHLNPGQQFTILDLGGVFVLSPKELRLDAMCDQLRDGLLSEGTSLKEMLSELRRLRKGEESRR